MCIFRAPNTWNGDFRSKWLFFRCANKKGCSKNVSEPLLHCCVVFADPFGMVWWKAALEILWKIQVLFSCCCDLNSSQHILWIVTKPDASRPDIAACFLRTPQKNYECVSELKLLLVFNWRWDLGDLLDVFVGSQTVLYCCVWMNRG